MGEPGTTLKALLKQRHLQEHRAFQRAYDKAARSIDPTMIGNAPSKATFYRWLSGDIAQLPYPKHCQVLEAMLPGWSAKELFQSWNADELPSGPPSKSTNPSTDKASATTRDSTTNSGQLADLTAVFTSRSAFAHKLPPHALLDHATKIQTVGLSLNLLCQQYPDQKLQDLLELGGRIQALFLEPDGKAIKAREKEEDLSPGHLTALTNLNMQVLQRLHAKLSPDAANRLEIRTYDETVRFNILIIDNLTCVVQPYLPDIRGVDSPTFVLKQQDQQDGLYPIFERVFTTLWEKGKSL